MPNDSGRARILRACYTFLMPVARFLLRSGISFREFSEVSRLAFVVVAGTDYGLRGRLTNISRVSAMTGIGRKEVRRLRRLQVEYEYDQRADVSPLTDVLHHWFTDPLFLDKQGAPKVLSMHGGAESFATLVKRCAGDRPVGAVKTELIRCGAVVQDESGNLKAERRYVVPDAVDERLVNALAFALRGLASTIAHNSDSENTELRIQRIVESEDLSDEQRQELKGILREKIMAFATDVDNLFPRSVGGQIERSHRIGVGVYYYEDSE